jgi:hypothetical protein
MPEKDEVFDRFPKIGTRQFIALAVKVHAADDQQQPEKDHYEECYPATFISAELI